MNVASLLPSGLDVYHAATTEDPNVRKGDIASAATGLALAPFTSRLGILGAKVHPWLQQKARNLVQKDAPPYAPAYRPAPQAFRSMNNYGANAIDLPNTVLE